MVLRNINSFCNAVTYIATLTRLTDQYVPDRWFKLSSLINDFIDEMMSLIIGINCILVVYFDV